MRGETLGANICAGNCSSSGGQTSPSGQPGQSGQAKHASQAKQPDRAAPSEHADQVDRAAHASQADYPEHAGQVLWFTGLSGAGKTTTARKVEAELRCRGVRVELLDGDELRESVCKGLGFSREDRLENIRRIVYVAGLLARHGVIVLVSAITPYRDMRDYARQELSRFVEIYVQCPLEICEERDVKGLYKKARSGEISRFTGISDPYESPEAPEIVICTSSSTVEENCGKIVSWVMDRRD